MTRRILLRVLVAMIYLERAHDARTFRLILPRRMKINNFGIWAAIGYSDLRDKQRDIINAIFSERRIFDRLLYQVEPVSRRDFKIPFYSPDGHWAYKLFTRPAQPEPATDPWKDA